MWRIHFASKQCLKYSFPSACFSPHVNVCHKTLTNKFIHSKKLSSTLSNADLKLSNVSGAKGQTNAKNDTSDTLKSLQRQQESLIRVTKPIPSKSKLNQVESDANNLAPIPHIDDKFCLLGIPDHEHSDTNLVARELKFSASQTLGKLRETQESLISVTRDLDKPESAVIESYSKTEAQVHKGPALEREGYSASSTLRAFTEACDVISEVPLALKSLRQIKSNLSRLKKTMAMDISLYHVMLRCVARESNFQVSCKVSVIHMALHSFLMPFFSI